MKVDIYPPIYNTVQKDNNKIHILHSSRNENICVTDMNAAYVHVTKCNQWILGKHARISTLRSNATCKMCLKLIRSKK